MAAKRKLMMICYAATWIVVVALPQLPQATIDDPSLYLPIVLAMIIMTFAFMYLAAKEALGQQYAKRNLIIACLLTPLWGAGFILWPPLVNSEINKRKRVPDTPAEN